jgi:serine/threonine-protein kinase
LLSGTAAPPDAVARFEREASLSGRISHPNLCHVYDFGRTPEGFLWLAMEFLTGETIAAALASGPMPSERVVGIATGCAAGLSAAHAAGIVHRDLTPANVMLVPRDGVETAVVMDFGIAWTPGGSDLTRDGMMVGTPEVMSPEQIAGDAVGPASDQYQLALLVCRMLTGHLPFQGATTRETMVMRLTVSPAPLAQLQPGRTFGAGVQAVLDRALARRPEDRYLGIRDLATAIGATLHGGQDGATEILARPSVGTRPTPRTQLGGRVILGLALAAGVGALAIVRPWEPGTASIPPAPPPVVQPPSPAPGTAPGTAAVPLAPPPPVPSSPAGTVPPLPTDAVFSEDPAVREEARLQAQAVYRSVSAPDSVRALAAYLVAHTFVKDTAFAEARRWLQRCLDLQSRQICRDMLSTLP